MANFERVAITNPPDGPELVVAETQVVVDFGHGQGPRGGLLTVTNGRVEARGSDGRVAIGSATLRSAIKEGAVTIPASVDISDPGNQSTVRITAQGPPGPELPTAIYISGSEARGVRRAALLRAGGNDTDGEVVLRDGQGDDRIQLSAGKDDGNLVMRDADQREALRFDSGNAALYLGADGNEGDLVVRDGQGKTRIKLSGGSGVAAGADAEDSDNLTVRDPEDREVLTFRSSGAALFLGADGNAGGIILRDAKGDSSIHIDGAAGDIELLGGDCAEDFAVAATPGAVEPGTVLVAAADDLLGPCAAPYDRRVAGVVSGAGDLRPGIRLGRGGEAAGRAPVALVGKVYCKVDAGYSPIAAGDLLTTSATPGHAMAARDGALRTGAVLGKALRGLADGCGMIPILVCLC